MLKHLLLPVTAWYVAGVVLAALVPLPLLPGLLIAQGVGLAVLGWERLQPVGLPLLLVLAGALNLTVHTTILAPHDLRGITGPDPLLVRVQGRLESTPSLREYGAGAGTRFRTLALLEVRALRTDEGWRPALGRVVVSTPGRMGAEWFGGCVVEVDGVLREPSPPRAPGLFDARRHYGWQGIHRQLECRDTNDWRLAAGPQPAGPGPADRFLVWAQRTLALGLPVEDEPLRLLWAMTLGWRTALTDEVSGPFLETGTMHIFAISGLHIALLAGMLVALLRVMQVPRGATGVGVVPLLWFYTAATGWQASAVRATLMMTLVIAGWAWRRPGNLVNSLSASALLILVGDPRQLFQASFQLSFFVVLSMALVGPPLLELRNRWCRTDPLVPEELLPRWRRWLASVVRPVTSSLVVSLAAWLGSLPLIAHYFQLVTPVGLLVNLVVVPLSSLALMSNLGALACGDWLPLLTGWFNHSAWFWMALLVRLCEGAAALPGAAFYVPAPGVAAVLAWYAVLVAVASGWALQPGRRRLAAGGLAVLVIGFGLAGWREHRTTSLTVLPLRGGEAVWVDAPGWGADLMVDSGSEFAAEHTVVPFLHAQGVNRLAHFVLTHGDARHVGGAPVIETNFAPAAIQAGPGGFRSPAYRAFLDPAGRPATVLRRVGRGGRVAGWTVLHPDPADRFSRADDAALVLAGELAGVRVVLMSDLGVLGQAALGARGVGGAVEVVIAGLPVAGEPLVPALLEALRPRLIVVSDDRQPTSARSGPGVRRRLRAGAAEVLFTSETGAVALRFRQGGWEVRDAEGRLLAVGRSDAGPGSGWGERVEGPRSGFE